MARAMVRRGHDVSIYTTNFNGADDLDVPLGVPVDTGGVSVTYFQVHAPRFWETCFPLGRALQADAGKFDLMHLHSLYMYHDRAGARAARRSGIPYIVRPHGTRPGTGCRPSLHDEGRMAACRPGCAQSLRIRGPERA